jgi:hypothetical protein
MRPQHVVRAPVPALLTVALLLCGAESSPVATATGGLTTAENLDAFSGISMPANATEIFAPESGFRVAGWNSWGGPNKLVEVAADGTEVKAGQVIARFDFQGKDALSHVQERLANAEAKATQRRLELQRTVDSLELDKKKKEIEAKLAQINVDKERALSKRQAEIYKIARQIADFEVAAIDARIASAKRESEAENAHQDLVIARAKAMMDTYKFYEKRTVITAPHDGIVRHAFNAQERRKIQKGDSIQSGVRVMSVAKDASLLARFYVPEHRMREIKEGTEVIVTTAGSGSAKEHRAIVKQIEYFPQELGFLLENNTLPNAREKAFAVRAEFTEPPEGLAAGTELLVKVASVARPSAAAASAAEQSRAQRPAQPPAAEQPRAQPPAAEQPRAQRPAQQSAAGGAP